MAASANEGGGRLGASMVPCGGWRLSGRLGVAQRRTSGARWSSLGAEGHGDEGLEADDERQSGVGGRSVAAAGRGENGFSFGPTAQRDDARGGGYMHRAWIGCGSQSTVPMRGGGSGRAAVVCA
jgi:hypothetical protein